VARGVNQNDRIQPDTPGGPDGPLGILAVEKATFVKDPDLVKRGHPDEETAAIEPLAGEDAAGTWEVFRVGSVRPAVQSMVPPSQ
jgi:hypothetical protein